MTLEILDLATHLRYTKMIHCGMARGVALLAPVAISIWVCPCTNTNFTWPYQIPSFIGNNYFCDTGNPGPGWSPTLFYPNDLLWDGEGCGPASTCCQLNHPPWFCTTLPQPTTDDIKLRICGGQTRSNGDVYVQFVDICIM